MIYRVIGHIEEKNDSKCLVLSLDKNYGKGSKMRLKQLMVIKYLNTTKILWGLNLTETIIYH